MPDGAAGEEEAELVPGGDGACWDESSEEAEHPQIVEPGTRKRVWRRRRPVRRGGDALATKYSCYTTDLLLPVSVTMLTVCWATANFSPIFDAEDAQPVYLVYNEGPKESATEKLEGALVNSAVIVLFFALVTSAMLLLYKCGCTMVIYGWLILSSAIILYFMAWIWLDLFCTEFQIPYDALSCAVILWNFGTVGVVCIYFRGHPRMTQSYLVATSAIMAWFLTRLPEWTTWCTLLAVAAYDIFAVLSPYGPLGALVEHSAQRDEPLPGLIYESRSFKLGLGDFVFYSVLVGRASLSSWAPAAASFLAVLSGLCGTLFCLGLFERALPALPIPICLGVATYFLADTLLTPWAQAAVLRGAMV
eukprot:TRINITY_DN50031_c0_g1_i1.p1 TRINITY_DN50031_c0_g1~~TRINITY_DN50031_c0_g1_i1.p1  ORF type:complete len:414 (+),score=127.88 TRINITY_DN50031_c0_g1_i1:158-1243(+)